MYKIVLIRHGQTAWNKKGIFCGWSDINLTKKGREEAIEAGKELRRNKFTFDYSFTSLLKRASITLKLILKELKSPKIPVEIDWRLNERHYGDLQGIKHSDMAKKVGEEQVFIWRRSYDVRPPKMRKNHPYSSKNDPRYKGIKVPDSESLKDVVERVVPFWKEEVIPKIKKGKKIIISASGNSMRALIKYLDKISSKDIRKLNIPTGVPLVYELDQKCKPIKSYYLIKGKKIKKKY